MDREIVVVLKGGNHMFACASGEALMDLTQKLTAACDDKTPEDCRVIYLRSEDCISWAVRVSEVAGFFVRLSERSVQERHTEALEKIAKAAEKQSGEGESWKEGGTA